MSEQEEIKKLERLSLPTNRFITNYKVAYDLVTTATTSHGTYWDLIKACEKHIAGDKPFKPDDLKQKGMAWAYNFNYGKASAKIEKGVAESTAKLSNALALGYVTFRASVESDHKDDILSFLEDDSKRAVVASIVGYALSSTLSKETRLTGFLNEVEYCSYSFGYSALIFDKFDWMPTPTHPLNIAFAPLTKPHDIRTWVVFKILTAADLYQRWTTAHNEAVEAQDQEEADGKPRKIVKSGWNLAGLEEVLLKAYRGKINNNSTIPKSWNEVIPLYSSNPSIVIQDTDDITIAKIFYKELDGTLSETYIPWENAWQLTENKGGTTNTPAAITNILFFKNHGTYVQSMHINLIRDSGFTSSGGSIQDMRGIAKYAVEDGVRYNRIRNGLGNKMTLTGCPMFEGSNTVSNDKFKVTVSQGFVLLPSTHTLVEKQPSFDIGSHINVLRFEEGEFMRDTQQYDATIQGRLTSRPNKGEVQRVTEEVEFTDAAKNNIKFKDYAATFYTVLKRIPTVVCKKSDPGYTGKRMFYDTIKKNIPWLTKSDTDVSKILNCIDSFVMDPVITDIQAITMALQMAETPFSRNRLKRMLLIAKGFPIEEVNHSVPLIVDKFSNVQDQRMAMMENDMFFTTNEVLVAGADDHIIHLDNHISKQQRVIKGVKEGALSPIDAFKYLENNQAHCLQHLDLFGQDPTFNEKAKEYGQALHSLSKTKEQIRAAAERMMQQQQEQASQIQLDPKVEAEIASKNAEAKSKIERTNWLAEQRTEQSNRKVELNHEQALARIEADKEIEKLKLER